MAFPLATMLNFPFFMSSFGSDDNHDESNEHFDFNISKELLLDPNDVLVGEIIAEGPNSIVFKGLFKDHVPVAVKIVQPSGTSAVSIQHKQEFQDEVLTLSSMKHNNIVKFVGACTEPHLMIITELLEGGTLQKFILNPRPNSPDLKMSLSFALDISRAMEYVHSKGFIHRDLNPRNVLVTGDMKQVKVADFGLATEQTTGGLACEVGSYRWMAPEVCSREPLKIGELKHYDQKVDVYSFALIFWALLTNQTPFREMYGIFIPYFAYQGKRPSLENVPDEFVPMLESCWAEDPEARLEFKEITILLEKLLNKFRSGSGNDTTITEEEADEDEMEDLETTSFIQNKKRSCWLKKKLKQKKKKLMNVILPFFKKIIQVVKCA